MSHPLLSILIPTIRERKEQYSILRKFIQNIIDLNELNERVEIHSVCDSKEMSIGEKRNILYHFANGLYSWQIDDDDQIPAWAIPDIIAAIASDADCITFEEMCLIDGVESRSNFSLQYEDWAENVDGFDHVRTPFFKTPIKTALCLQVPVPDMRFGEDHEWAKKIKSIVKTELHLPKICYYYIRNSSPHNTRYGIT